MEWYDAFALMVGLGVLLMALTVPVSFAFFAVNIVGLIVFVDFDIGLKQLVANVTTSITSFTLVPVPLFLLMGELFYHTGVAVRVFDAFDALLGRLPGRLSYLTVAGGTVFAALSGSSMANTAMLGSLMVPEMTRRGYKKHMAMGPILGTGGLAIIIPPSALAVLLGSLARIDIGQLLIAGVLPGVLLAGFYALTIYVLVKLDPEAAPAYEVPAMRALERVRIVVVNLAPMGFVIFMVIGLILLGVATPSEAAAFGVLGVLIVSAGFGKLTWTAIVKSLQGTMKVTGMVFLIIMASSTFSQILALSGATAGLIDWATALEVSPTLMLAVMFVILLVLGCLMEQVSIMMLTVPIFFPLAQSLGFDLIWFGVIVMLSLEIGLITPPFGLGLFVLIGVAPKGTTLFEAAAAGLPYIACAVALVACLVAFPPIALYLPSLMQ